MLTNRCYRIILTRNYELLFFYKFKIIVNFKKPVSNVDISILIKSNLKIITIIIL